MELKEISELLKAQTAEILQNVDKMIDSKLEPIRNDIGVIKNDLSNLRLHTDSINNRLSKLEDRMARVETKLDNVLLSNKATSYAA